MTSPPNDAAFYFYEQTRLDSRKGFEHYKAFLGRKAPAQIIERGLKQSLNLPWRF